MCAHVGSKKKKKRRFISLHFGSKNIIAHVAHFCNVNLCKTYFTELQIKGFVFFFGKEKKVLSFVVEGSG